MLRLLLLILILWSAPAPGRAKLVIAVLGDSLTSGFELGVDEGYVPVLERELLAKGYNVDLKSAAIAGNRRGRGATGCSLNLSCRLILCCCNWVAMMPITACCPKELEENLDYMITNFQRRGQLVVFLANKFTPKYGQNYRAEIEDLFDELPAIMRFCSNLSSISRSLILKP